jgi:hypothetical protein
MEKENKEEKKKHSESGNRTPGLPDLIESGRC